MTAIITPQGTPDLPAARADAHWDRHRTRRLTGQYGIEPLAETVGQLAKPVPDGGSPFVVASGQACLRCTVLEQYRHRFPSVAGRIPPPPLPGAPLPWPRRFPLSLVLALCAYLCLAALTVRSVGVVGEVALGWSTGRAPAALVQADPARWASGTDPATVGHHAGPLVSSAVRPLEAIEMGGFALPLAINSYTGGPPDWPARLLFTATGSPGAVTALHVLLGALLLVLVHRFVRLHGTDVAAAAATLLLATDWHFLFYKKVLGGTEILLQAAGLLCLWAVWSRRWGGGRHGLTALGVGVGLGLLAKSTFAITLVALGLAVLFTRWDRPGRSPPLPDGLWKPVVAVIALTSPLWISALHRALAPELPVDLRTHDLSSSQWDRVLNALQLGETPVREGLGNILSWAGDPLGFLGRAYGVEGGGWSPWRAVGWLLLWGGAALAWRDRHPTPRLALHRLCTVFLIFQVGLLLLVARDLHHLAQAAPTLAIVAGLSIDALAGLRAPPRGPSRARLALLLALPWMLDGARTLRHTDDLVERIAVPTFTRSGQAALLGMLEAAGVERLVVADYESYGVFETLAPGLRVEHAWPLVAREHKAATPAILRHAAGAHLLVPSASAPMVYNLRTNAAALGEAAAEAGLVVREVSSLPDGQATLYTVERR